ncbi:MAG TPA: DUF559 domain-containing protein [Solirubrobacteraceae bacterium]
MVALALGQEAVFAAWQLQERGLSARWVQARADTGHLYRIHHGVYGLLPKRMLTSHALFMAAVLACGPVAAVSHRSAADLLGLLRNRRVNIDVTIAGRSGRKRPGLDIHRSRTLLERDVTMVGPIRCTSVARTLLDIAPRVSEGQLTRAFDQSEILEVFDLHAIKDQLKRNPTHPGCRRIRGVLEQYTFSGQSRGEFEPWLHDHLRASGLPLPQRNEWIVLDDGERAICADFCWRAQKLIVETDGKRTHLTHRAFERDRRDDQRLIAAGWTVIRITWKQLMTEPDRVIALITELLVTKQR